MITSPWKNCLISLNILVNILHILCCKCSCDKTSASMLSVAVKLFNCLCAGWRRAVLTESWPGACGHRRRLVGLPPPEQRGSGWAAESSPACHHPGALWTGTHSITYWWGTHTLTFLLQRCTCTCTLAAKSSSVFFCNWLISQTRIVCTWKKSTHSQQVI